MKKPAAAETSSYPANAVARGFASMISDARHRPIDFEHFATFIERGGHQSVALAVLLELIPEEIDAEQWMSWLEGGEPPRPIKLRDPALHQSPRATGAQDRARRDRDKAACEVDRMKAKLAEAEAALASTNMALTKADDQVRVTVFFQVLHLIITQATGAFAMGPAFTIMRAISPHLQEDILYESRLDVAAQFQLDQRRKTRAAESTEILDLLDRHAGDIVLEVNLHRDILKTLRARNKVVKEGIESKPKNQKVTSLERRVSLRRTTMQQRESMRSDAPQADRAEVLGELIEALDEIRASRIIE